MFTVTREGQEAVIAFYTDVVEVEHDDHSAWETTTWITHRPWADNIEKRIAADPGIWFDMIKAETDREENAEQVSVLNDEFQATLVDTVLDVQYRLTVLEIINA